MSISDDLDNLKNLLGENLGCGWMVDDVAMFLYSIVKFYRPSIVIQTGHLWGKSALFILEALKSNDVPLEIERGILSGDNAFFEFTKKHYPKYSVGRLISIDPNIFHLNTDVYKYLNDRFSNFSIFEMTSDDFFSTFDIDYVNETILAVVDGDHTPDGCMRDLKNLEKLGAKVIIIDDTLWLPELKECCETFAKESGYGFSNFPIYNGIGLLTKNE